MRGMQIVIHLDPKNTLINIQFNFANVYLPRARNVNVVLKLDPCQPRQVNSHCKVSIPKVEYGD